MRLFASLLVGTVSLIALAAEPQSDEFQVQVHAVDPRADLSSLTDPAYIKTQGVPAPRRARLQIPSPAERDELFKTVGLLPAAAKMDEMDRDVIYRRAYRLSKDELVKEYPDLPKDALVKLHQHFHK